METKTIELPKPVFHLLYIFSVFIGFGAVASSFTENFRVQLLIGGIGVALAVYGVWDMEQLLE